MSLSHTTDTDINLSSHFLRKYGMLEASMFSYHPTLDVTGHVHPSHLDFDKYSNHPLSCL